MKTFALFFALPFVMAGCMSSEFVLTGQNREPLPIHYPVKVILPESRQNIEYEDIGILRVKQSDMDNLSKAVELARKEARLRGGDIVILSSSDTNAYVSGFGYGLYSSESNLYMFTIGKMKQ
jgi:hypothetical protein